MSLTGRLKRFPAFYSRSLSILGLLALIVWLVPAIAAAAPKDNRERAAKKACLSGDYAKGVALLANLYVDTDDINFLFNQGRCFEQNGKYDEAVP